MSDDNGLKANRTRIIIRPGEYIEYRKTIYKVTQNIDFESVVAIDIKTGKAKTLIINEIQSIEIENDINHAYRDFADFSDSEWHKIEIRFDSIKPVINCTSQKEIKAQAIKCGVHYTTLYRWLRNYRSTGTVTGLLRQKPGPKKGKLKLNNDVEEVIEQIINDYYLTQQRPSAQRVIELVNIECRKKDISAPSKNTVRARIQKISEYDRLRKQGNRSKAQTKYKPAPGMFPNADYPLAVVQIDHTPADVIIVDDKSRLPIGRPWITLSMDIYSRMVTGYYLSLDAPSETSVAMCIANSVLPKDEWLLRHDIDAEWPVWGFMQTIHVDNGADFRSDTLKRSCLPYNINLEFRPVGQPNFGGHIERILGTIMKRVHSLPGTTFSNIKERDNYNSDKHASMTFSEFELWLVTYITKVYHQQIHSSIGMSPSRKWEIGIFGDKSTEGIGYMPKPSDFRTTLIDFLPLFDRTIQKNGVNIDGLNYYDHVIRVWINTIDNKTMKKRKFIFRRDPRDISYIWFYEPELATYYKLPLANQSIPAMNIWEYKAARNRMKEKGITNVSEHALIDAHAELHQQAQDSVKKSKQARRLLQKKEIHEKGHSANISQPKIQKTNDIDESIWDEDIDAFD